MGHTSLSITRAAPGPLKHKLDYLCSHADHPNLYRHRHTGNVLPYKGTYRCGCAKRKHCKLSKSLCFYWACRKGSSHTQHPQSISLKTQTHTQCNFCSPDNKCHIIVMYSGGPHHIKVAVMESQFEAAGLDMWNQILKPFMALWSQTASLFSCKQSTGSWWCISEAFHKSEFSSLETPRSWILKFYKRLVFCSLPSGGHGPLFPRLRSSLVQQQQQLMNPTASN